MFDESRADRILNYFSICNHVDGFYVGDPIVLHDFQQFDMGCIYGWVRKKDGLRRFKSGYIQEARGNAKTTMLSACGCYTMTSDAWWPPGHPELRKYIWNPEVNCVAVDSTDASKAWEGIRNIALASPKIEAQLKINRWSIENKKRGGMVIRNSKDARNKEGKRPALSIVDEYHNHLTDDVRDAVKKGGGKTPQFLEIIITTAGEDAENKPCYRDYKYYKRVLSGEVTADDIFIMIRELDEGDNPHEETLWNKPNPMLRYRNEYSAQLRDYIKSEHDKAYGTNDQNEIRRWLIKRMNLWQEDAENKYFSGCMDRWKSQAVSPAEFAELSDGLPVWVGFDLGKSIDLSGIGCVFWIPSIKKFGFKIQPFMPQDSAQAHEHSDRVPYLAWAKEGHITLTPGEVTDYNYLEHWIYTNDEEHGWDLQEIGYDGHNAVQLAQNLADVYGDEKIIEIRQTCSGLNAATKRFRELVLQDQCIHEENPIFDWCLSNAVEVIDNYGDIKLSKRTKDDTQRIDPVAATINALARAIVHRPEDDINDRILSDDWGF